MQLCFPRCRSPCLTATPVQLWLERARRNKDVLQDAPAAKVSPKPPHKVEVCYPFSSDRALQEQVTMAPPVQGIRQLKALSKFAWVCLSCR